MPYLCRRLQKYSNRKSPNKTEVKLTSQTTHPDYTTLVDPLCYAKRVKNKHYVSPSFRRREGAGGELNSGLFWLTNINYLLPMRHNLEQTLLDKITDTPALTQKIKAWQAEGKKIVFTNGVFDLLHLGHITYMAKAAELGDKLVIGLNSDASVKRLKGESRPVNDQSNRAALLAALFFIDGIVIFEDDTPRDLIATLLPDVLVKGADYTVDQIAGAKEVLANGGVVKTISLVEGYSSTSIINKIRGQK